MYVCTDAQLVYTHGERVVARLERASGEEPRRRCGQLVPCRATDASATQRRRNLLGGHHMCEEP